MQTPTVLDRLSPGIQAGLELSDLPQPSPRQDYGHALQAWLTFFKLGLSLGNVLKIQTQQTLSLLLYHTLHSSDTVLHLLVACICPLEMDTPEGALAVGFAAVFVLNPSTVLGVKLALKKKKKGY